MVSGSFLLWKVKKIRNKKVLLEVVHKKLAEQ